MQNYESPTIESVGGAGNKLEPQVNIPVAITDVALAAEFYLTAVAFTNAVVAVLPIVAAVVFKTTAVNN